MTTSKDVIVIGAGVIGCSIAYRLAKAGLQVTVIERGQPGQEASWAAAGMLAPHSETTHGAEAEFTRLCHASLKLYPDFIHELEALTGISIGYQTTGSIMVAKDFKEATVLAGLFERQKEAGKEVEELSSQQLKQLEPDLANTIQTAIFFPNDHYVNNRILMQALITGMTQSGVKLVTDTPVLGLDIDGEHIKGVRMPGNILYGDRVVNAAGCWSPLLDTSSRISVPVRPIRGQIVQLQKQPQTLRHLIHSSDCYIVPWPDGRALVGSTVENVGYNANVTAEGVKQLLTAALQVAPGLKTALVREVWAGLRPDTPDNLPILGYSDLENLIMATGHFRNGILLAPITAKLITELIVSGKPSISLETFRPQRFGE